ncbi:DUF3575 domain-containing protein [Chitinophaga silvisoli]|uniref:DUF3575 domain-containing protein n=1 Tax=Chitinophaga silvisoli TaxID=2291814 RepID=A0A3E1P989_9BACT|nr:DUF3575 domain-containing protein [Chitinophaga silvisoli]RFM36598.1 DUF3575 domain-containing protein [Chitinophaga silvisoli]
MKQLYFIFLLTGCMMVARAQSSLKGMRIFVNVPSFTEFDGGPALGLEYRIKNNISVALEGQWILYDANDWDAESHGFRFTPEIKFFLPGRKHRYKWFFAAQALYKQVNSFEDYIIPHYEDNEQVYEELRTFEKQKQVFAFGGRFGVQSNFGGKKEKFFVELSVGSGFRWKGTHFIQRPPEGSMKRGRKPLFDTEGWLPDVPFKVRFGYRL